MILLSGPYSNRHGDYSYMSCCGDLSEILSSCPTLVCMDLEKKDSFSSTIPSQKGERKIGNLSLESCSQISEKMRIQYLPQFIGRKQNLKTVNKTRI